VAAPTCDSKIQKAGYTAETIRESANARSLVERQRTALKALPSAERGFGAAPPTTFSCRCKY